MELVVHLVAWWVIGLLGGVAQATNHKLIAGFCVVMTMTGFTATTLDVHNMGHGEYAAARGGNDYHNARSVCMENVSDPIKFATEEDAQEHGFGPCERCIQHNYDGDLVVAQQRLRE